jgi:hypothetical protein
VLNTIRNKKIPPKNIKKRASDGGAFFSVELVGAKLFPILIPVIKKWPLGNLLHA